MSSPSISTNLPSDLDHADRLKRELSEFATEGALKGEYERQQKLFFESSAPVDEAEQESLLDWFLFDWFDENGEGVVDHFLASRLDLDGKERAILLDWKDSINSVFEIRLLGKNALTLRELDTKDSFPVVTLTALDQTPFKRGQCIGARLLPLGDRFIFSGLQCIMPDREAATGALEMRRRLEALISPEAVEKAQREQRDAFCEFFGCDELAVGPGELASTLGKFQRYLFEERRDPDTGATRIEEFKSQFGQAFNVPEMPPLPKELVVSGDVTILCDEFDGLVLLPDYEKFKTVFDTDSSEAQIAGWQELVWNYIKDPDIPIVAFERVAERRPARVEKVFRQLLGDKGFSLEHLYAVLLHYKEPVEGMKDLSDDQRLWDFFDGNKKAPRAARKVRSKAKAEAKVRKTSSRAKRQTSSKTKSATRRSSVTESAGGPTKRAAKTSAVKRSSPARTPAKRKAVPAVKTRRATGRTAPAKKR
ncbi:MAG TPA: hypothetical protein VGV87_29300 [Blastocatellia bacterium]|nr:hypothetical protein [Blastocatellia bacterium]